MEITEDLLYAEIGRATIRARVLENNLRASLADNRRLASEVEALKVTLNDAVEAADGVSD